MKLSIVTPSYQQGKYIERTIESVLGQGYPDLEYIVMDGGSKDETVDILKKYGDQIIWESKKDKGQTDALCQGIAKSTGEVIGWLNSDDIYYPGTFEKVMQVFETHPEVNVIYGNANHIDEQDGVMEPYYTEPFSFERLKDVCFICQPSVFFRKAVVEKYGYPDVKLQYCMDYEFWVRLGKKETFYYLEETLAGSRLYADNKTLGARRKVHEEICMMLAKHCGKTPAKWIYNLAHVLVDEMGIDRAKSPEEDKRFVAELAKVTPRLFLRYNHWINKEEIKTILSWKKYGSS